jgi:cysteinyl-tRNA synthetase
MTLKLFNTLTRQKETFTPTDAADIGMYVCGPTVYDRAHIGNARAVVVFDSLYRILQQIYGKEAVTYVRNITDVDDKINLAAKERNITIGELTKETTQMFHEDMGALLCLPPTHEPRATQHIAHMVSMIERLVDKGFAYAKEGHVLFNTTRYENYGALSNRSLDEMVAGARVEVAPYKENPTDFVLWKPSNEEEPGWDSPWGFGRPGWHIECSVMSTQHLGETFDIHGGGADLQFPHHENEIAQSCCAHEDSHYARYWVHNGFLTVNGEKMSKSLGNFITVHDLREKEVPGEVIRLALMSTHYRKPLDWNDKVVQDAKKALDSFYRVLQDNETNEQTPLDTTFLEALADDMNIPLAISQMHYYASECNKGNDSQHNASLLLAAGKLLGLLQEDPKQWFHTGDNDNSRIEELIEQRTEARKNKDWAESDRIRDLLKAEGILLEDTAGGTTWRKE